MVVKYEYLPENLLIPAQAWGLYGFCYEKLGVFVYKDLNRISIVEKERRFAPKLDAPAIFIEFGGVEKDQEDYAFYNYYPTGAFIGKNIPEMIDDPDFNSKIFGKIGEEEFEIDLKGIKWDTFPIWENYPVPDIAEDTPFENVGKIAATYQRITSNWTIRFMGKVLDIFSDSIRFSASSFISTFRKYFPPNVFIPIAVKEFPLPDKTKIQVGLGGLFWVTLNDHRFSEIFYEGNRRLIVEVSLSARQTVIGAFSLDQFRYFPVFVGKSKESFESSDNFFNLIKEDP